MIGVIVTFRSGEGLDRARAMGVAEKAAPAFEGKTSCSAQPSRAPARPARVTISPACVLTAGRIRRTPAATAAAISAISTGGAWN